jgi:hypothetical protein
MKNVEKRGYGVGRFRQEAGGSFPDPYVRRLLRSRNESPPLVSNEFPIF